MFQPRLSRVLPFGLLLGFATGCPSDDEGPSSTSVADTGTDTSDPTGDPTTMPPTTGDPTGDPTTDTLDTTEGPDTEGDTETDTDTEGPQPTFCERLGEETGITEVVGAAIGATLEDPRINGYFLNADVDGDNLSGCLVIQLAALAECEGFEYPTDDCRPMDEAHEGLGISQADFDDLAGHFNDALEAADVGRDDISTIMTALGDMAGDIVEDETSDANIYQRFDRKPGIQNLIVEFVDELASEAAVAAFFFDLSDPENPQPVVDIERVLTCLTRQLCGDVMGGPCVYGGEVDAEAIEPGVSADNQCQDMATSHADVTSTIGDAVMTADDFEDFLDAMERALATAFPGATTIQDRADVVTALAAMQGDIVPAP